MSEFRRPVEMLDLPINGNRREVWERDGDVDTRASFEVTPHGTVEVTYELWELILEQLGFENTYY